MVTRFKRELRIISASPDQTAALGVELGALLQPGDLLCLSGALGAGKTVFSRGLGAGFGATDALTSPTYNLVHEHRRDSDKTKLYHIDLYRISGPVEADSLGLDDILDEDHIVIIEWSERISDILPAERLWIDFETRDETTRALHFAASGERYRTLIESLAAQVGE